MSVCVRTTHKGTSQRPFKQIIKVTTFSHYNLPERVANKIKLLLVVKKMHFMHDTLITWPPHKKKALDIQMLFNISGIDVCLIISLMCSKKECGGLVLKCLDCIFCVPHFLLTLNKEHFAMSTCIPEHNSIHLSPPYSFIGCC